jgi:CheY-like chemotaxis protein
MSALRRKRHQPSKRDPSLYALADTAIDWEPDVILMDVMMPVMDGPETLSHLRENARTAKIPVVFMTARAQTREVEHFLSLGAAGVILKPFDPNDAGRGRARLPARLAASPMIALQRTTILVILL